MTVAKVSFIVLIGLASAQLGWEAAPAAITCGKYACASSPLTAGTCISLVNNTYSLATCSDATKSYCDTTKIVGGTSLCTLPPTPTFPPVTAYVGQACNTTVTCAYGTCTNQECKGSALGEKCTTSNDCDKGLRCKGGVCLSVLMVGDEGCLLEEDCELKSGCNLLKGSQLGFCVPYFSVQVGGIATDCVNSRSRLCASTYCRTETSWLAKQSYCIGAPQSIAAIPTVCNYTSNCTGISRPWTFPGTCSCGYNPQGNANCALFPGDAPVVAAQATLLTIVQKQNFFSCNTLRRFQPDCLKMVDPTLYTQYRYQRLFVDFYPQLQNNDNCVQKMYTSYYWTKKSAQVLLAGLIFISSGF